MNTCSFHSTWPLGVNTEQLVEQVSHEKHVTSQKHVAYRYCYVCNHEQRVRRVRSGICVAKFLENLTEAQPQFPVVSYDVGRAIVLNILKEICDVSGEPCQNQLRNK